MQPAVFHPYHNWAVLTAFIFIYSIFAKRLEKTWISGALVFVVFGWLFGPFGLGLIHLRVNSENLKMIAELTLAVILFTDAANANLSTLKNTMRMPLRLLLVGLPLTILLGFGVGKLLFNTLSLVEVGLLATVLAPTDAALGKAVVTNPQVPDSIREDLNVESGLNDGICVPILFALLAIAVNQASGTSPPHLVLQLFVEEIGIGILVGASFAVLGMQLVAFSARQNWRSGTWHRVTVAALAIACFATAQNLGGSGFIASFVGGLIFGSAATADKEELLQASEAIGDTLSLVTWVAFGSAIVGLAIEQLTWQILLYAILSLTVIRMVPVWLCLFGTTLDTESKLFVGWFGPRGLASIVFAVIVLDADLPGSMTIAVTVACTVILSVLAHGLTANPWANQYGQRMQQRIGVPRASSEILHRNE